MTRDGPAIGLAIGVDGCPRKEIRYSTLVCGLQNKLKAKYKSKVQKQSPTFQELRICCLKETALVLEELPS